MSDLVQCKGLCGVYLPSYYQTGFCASCTIHKRIDPMADREQAVMLIERADVIAVLEQAVDRCNCALTCDRCALTRGVLNKVRAGEHVGASGNDP